MEELRYTIEPGDAGVRIDKYVALRLGKSYSRTYVKFLIENGHLSVNDKSVKPHYMTHDGDEVFLELFPLPQDHDIEPQDIPLEILYEDGWMIVLNKSAGMVVHPGAGNWNGTLVNALLYHCGSLPTADDDSRPGVVHRLDKDTSGVIVVAKNDRALRVLSKQFQKRVVKKVYVAVVKGRVEFDNGIVDAPIARHSTLRKKMAVDIEGGKAARTVYHTVRRLKKFTVVRLEPETGRTHQIRVHLKHIGYPIVGDIAYGGDRSLARHALHAESLGLTHPDTGERMEFTVAMPKDMREFIERNSV